MASPSSAVEVGDPRDDRRRLRLSWHPERRELIVSHWRENVCIATTPVGVKEIAGLIGLLVEALQDAATTSPPPTKQLSGRRYAARFLTAWRRRVRGAVTAATRYRMRVLTVDDGDVNRVA